MSSLDFQVEKRKNNFVIITGLPMDEFASVYPSEATYLSTFLINDEYVVPKNQLCNVLDKCFDHFTEEGLIHITKLLDKNDDIRERIHEQSVSKKKQKKERLDYKFQDTQRQDVSVPKQAQRQDAPRQDAPRQEAPRQDVSVPRQDESRQDVLRPDSQRQDVLRPDSQRQDVLRPDVLRPDVLRPDVLRPDVLRPDVLRPDVLRPDSQRQDVYRQDSYRQDVSRKEYKHDSRKEYKQEYQDYPQDYEFKLKSDLLKMFYQMKTNMEQMERYLHALK